MTTVIKGQFPNETERQRILTLQKFAHLYENEQNVVFQLHEVIRAKYKNLSNIIYISHAIPSKVSDFYGDFVQGDAQLLKIDFVEGSDEDRETLQDIVKTNNLIESIYDYAVNQSEFGFEVLLGSVKDGKFVIQSVGKDQYFPQRDGSVIFATYIRDPQSTLPIKQRDLYLYTQHYRVENGSVIIERQAWKCDMEGKADTPVDFTRVGLDATIQQSEKIEGLDVLPIVQIDNGRKTKWGFGKSDYQDIMPNLQELNERTTHVATQLLANMDAILEIPKLSTNRDKAGNFVKIDTLELTDKDIRSKYVTNDNPLIEETYKHLDRQLHFMSWVTGVPMNEMMESSQPERVETMRIRMFNAIRRTDTKRSKLTKGLIDLITIGFKMLGKELKSEIYITYSDVIPSDPQILAQTEETKVTAGLSSRRSAMKRLENYTDEEADAELELIKKEDIQSGAVNPNNAPTI